jgi:hypothetical protein
MPNAWNSASVQLRPADFNIASLADEIRVDRLCQELLQDFHRYLLEELAVKPLKAGTLRRGSDYFLRDFVVDSLRANIFTVAAAQVRGFAGNWYIHRALEPNASELADILEGIAAFYRFSAAHGWVDQARMTAIADCCAEVEFYRERIESFHQLAGDDYPAWCRRCPLP